VVAILVSVGIIALAVSSGSSNSDSSDSDSGSVAGKATDGFKGDPGITVTAQDSRVYIDEGKINDGDMHSFNYYSETENKNIYFFVVKANDGTYRVAANACEVCHDTKKGFTQVGNKIKCNNCGTTYSKDQIAMQKGGCNPRPIDKNAEVAEGQLVIAVSDIEDSAELF